MCGKLHHNFWSQPVKTLTIRVSDEEHAIIQTIACKRFMNITGMVRAHFDQLAREHGLQREETTSAATPAKPAELIDLKPRYGSMLADLLLPDGTINHQRLVSRMRTKADNGVTRQEFSRDYGISTEDMEAACNATAKDGELACIYSWHKGARLDELNAMRDANMVYQTGTKSHARVAASKKPQPSAAELDAMFDDVGKPDSGELDPADFA